MATAPPFEINVARVETLAEIVRSHERLNEERWAQNDRRLDEYIALTNKRLDDITQLIVAVKKEQMDNNKDQHEEMNAISAKLDNLSTTYSSRFWQLALTIIVMLVTALGSLFWRYLEHGT